MIGVYKRYSVDLPVCSGCLKSRVNLIIHSHQIHHAGCLGMMNLDADITETS